MSNNKLFSQDEDKYGITDYFKDTLYEWKLYELPICEAKYSPYGLIIKTNYLKYGLETNFSPSLGFRVEAEIDVANFLEKSKNAVWGMVCWNTMEDNLLGIFIKDNGTLTAIFRIGGQNVFPEQWINIPAVDKSSLKIRIRSIRKKFSFFVNDKEFVMVNLESRKYDVDKIAFDWIGFWQQGDAEMIVSYFDFEAFRKY